jgi:hypothetical protein
MKAASASHGILWHLKKLVFFGVENSNVDGTIDARAVVVRVAALFCAASILILLFL